MSSSSIITSSSQHFYTSIVLLLEFAQKLLTKVIKPKRDVKEKCISSKKHEVKRLN